MKNFIAELYMGNYYTSSYSNDENTQERNRILDNCDSLYKQLVEKFTDEEKTLLNELQLKEADLWSDEIDQAFARGVKIGMLLQTSLDKIKL